jgi:choice-of-anchor B domain-containing protein
MKNLILILSLICVAAGFSQDAPLNMTLLSHINYQTLHGANLNDVWGYVDETGKEYAIVGTTKGTSIVDISNPASPVEVFWVAGSESIWRDPCVSGNHAYITTEAQDGLTIIDLSPLPQSNDLPVSIYTGPQGNEWESAHTCFVSPQGFAYIFGANRGGRGVIILDVQTDPMNPIELGVFDEWYVHDGFERNDTLYLGHIYDGFFSLVDVSDKSNPVLLGTQTTSSLFTHNVWPSSSGQYAFTTDEVSGAFIDVYDISDPNNMVLVEKIQHSPGMGVIPHNVHVVGDYLVTSYYSDGVIIHDATNPKNLVKVGQFDTYPTQTTGFNGCWGVYPFFPSGNMVAADITEGLFILGANYQKAAYLEGVVKEQGSNAPLNDVRVKISVSDQPERTSPNGEYATGIFGSGTYDVTFFKVGYFPKTEQVILINGQTSFKETFLTPIPPFFATVEVKDAQTNQSISDAHIKLSHPLIEHENLSNGLGEREFTLFYRENYEIFVGKWGYRTNCSSQVIDETTNTITVFLSKGYYDDFEFDFGWNVSGNAVTGKWERGIPNPTNQTVMDADANYDCGKQAYVTGNHPNQNPDFDDVDKGTTTLISPQMDWTNLNDVHVSYAWAFYCFHGPETPDDELRILLSNGTQVIQIDAWGGAQGNPMNFEYREKAVSGLIPFTTTMQLFVRISDEDPNMNVTEAAFDHFQITEGSSLNTMENVEEELEVYPNPTQGMLFLKNLKVGEELVLMDLSGRCIFTSQVDNPEMKISLEAFKPGVYLLTAGKSSFKIIKK